MSSQAQALAHLEEYARNIKERTYDVDCHGDEQAYEARLNKTLIHLKDQVQREQNILQTVKTLSDHGVESSTLLIKHPSYEPSLQFKQTTYHLKT